MAVKTVIVLPGPTGPTGTIKGVNILSAFTGSTGQFAQWLQATGSPGPNGLIDKVYNIGPTGLTGQHKTVIIAGLVPPVPNLLLQPNSLLSAPWIGVQGGSGTPIANVLTAPAGLLGPDGVSQAFRLALTGAGGTSAWSGLQQVVNFPAATAGKFSFYMKSSASGGAANVTLATNNNIAFATGIAQKFALSAQWQKFTLSGVIQTGGTAAQFLVSNLASAATPPTVDATCNGNVDIAFGFVSNP